MVANTPSLRKPRSRTTRGFQATPGYLDPKVPSVRRGIPKNLNRSPSKTTMKYKGGYERFYGKKLSPKAIGAKAIAETLIEWIISDDYTRTQEHLREKLGTRFDHPPNLDSWELIHDCDFFQHNYEQWWQYVTPANVPWNSDPSHPSSGHSRTQIDEDQADDIYPAFIPAPGAQYDKLRIYSRNMNPPVEPIEGFFDMCSVAEYERTTSADPKLKPAMAPIYEFRGYRRVKPQLEPKLKPVHNIGVQVNTVTGVATFVKVGQTTGRQNDVKHGLGGGFATAYFYMRLLADALGEAYEWIEILSDAAGYDPLFGKYGNAADWGVDRKHEIADRFEMLFFEGGWKNIDWKEFLPAVAYNQLEDAFFGKLGTELADLARQLGMSKGFQTGPAI